MKRLTALRLACVLSAAGVIATTLVGCASTNATADTPMRQATATTSAPTGVTPQVTGAGTGGAAPATRDWAQVDTNRDNLISPEEMSAYLQANPGPLKGR